MVVVMNLNFESNLESRVRWLESEVAELNRRLSKASCTASDRSWRPGEFFWVKLTGETVLCVVFKPWFAISEDQRIFDLRDYEHWPSDRQDWGC